MTKLSSALPGGEANGLGSIAHDLIESPHKVHVVVALVDCKSIQTDTDTGDQVATARIRRLEPIHMDKARVADLLRRAVEERTGQAVLPYELEEDLKAALADVETEE